MIDVRQTNELTPQELVTIFKERTRVFVVEQTCYYQEVDDEDYQCFHVRILDDQTNELMAYARIMPKKDSVTFGRVLVVEKFRRQGGWAISCSKPSWTISQRTFLVWTLRLKRRPI